MNRTQNIASATRPCSPILLAVPNTDELLYLRDRLLQAGVTRALVTFNEADSLVDYLGAVCIADPAEPRLKPCLLFVDERLLAGEKGDLIEWIRRQRVLQHLRVVVLSDREPARAPSAAVHFVSRFPAAATLALMVASACGGNMS